MIKLRQALYDLAKTAVSAWAARRYLLHKRIAVRLRGMGRRVTKIEQLAEMIRM